MLYTFSVLWLVALSYTVWKRGRQIKRAKKVLQFNQLHYEQEIERRQIQKTEKAEEESNNTGESSD